MLPTFHVFSNDTRDRPDLDRRNNQVFEFAEENRQLVSTLLVRFVDKGEAVGSALGIAKRKLPFPNGLFR